MSNRSQLSITIDADTSDEITAVATAARVSRSWLIGEIVSAWLSHEILPDQQAAELLTKMENQIIPSPVSGWGMSETRSASTAQAILRTSRDGKFKSLCGNDFLCRVVRTSRRVFAGLFEFPKHDPMRVIARS